MTLDLRSDAVATTLTEDITVEGYDELRAWVDENCGRGLMILRYAGWT